MKLGGPPWRTGTHAQRPDVRCHRPRLRPDGTLLVSSTAEGTLKFWAVPRGELLRTHNGHTSEVTRVTFSPDGGLFASASADGTVKLWDTQSGKRLRTLSGLGPWVVALTFNADGTTLAAALVDGTVKVWATPLAIGCAPSMVRSRL